MTTAPDPQKCRKPTELEHGVTFIEVTLVVVVLGILMAITIATLLGARTRAQARSVQSSLRIALTDAKGIFTDTNSYLTATPAKMLSGERSLTYNAAGTASTGPRVVSVNAVSPAAGGTAIIMTAKSKSGVCYVIGDWSTGRTAFARLATGATCSGTQAATTLKTVRPNPAATSNSSATTGAWVAAW